MDVGQPSDNDVSHGDINERFARSGACVVVLPQAAIPPQPGNRPFHHLASRQHVEARYPMGTLAAVQEPATNALHPFHHLASIAPIGPHHPQVRLLPMEVAHHQPCPVPVLDIGGMHHHRHHHAHGIHQQMACASVDVVASISPVRPPFSVVVTDWRSRIAALGAASRPAATRTSVRSAAWIRPQVSSRCQRRTEWDTVCQGGTSSGRIRQAHPLRTIAKMAFSISRYAWTRCRARRDVRSGRAGAIRCHSASVRSVR